MLAAAHVRLLSSLSRNNFNNETDIPSTELRQFMEHFHSRFLLFKQVAISVHSPRAFRFSCLSFLVPLVSRSSPLVSNLFSFISIFIAGKTSWNIPLEIPPIQWNESYLIGDDALSLFPLQKRVTWTRLAITRFNEIHGINCSSVDWPSRVSLPIHLVRVYMKSTDVRQFWLAADKLHVNYTNFSSPVRSGIWRSLHALYRLLFTNFKLI